jgi:hypothetical protein
MVETYDTAFRCHVFKKKKLAARNNKSEGMRRTREDLSQAILIA